MKNGAYAYRFDGASMADGTAYHLVGVGRMTLKGGRITGAHRSAVMPLKGQDAALTHTVFRLTGQARPAKDGFIPVTITFTCTQAAANGVKLPLAQVLVGTFDFVPAGEDRYWLIGSGARNKTLKSWAAEAVLGEVVRLGD